MPRLLALVVVLAVLAGAWACGRDEPEAGEARLVVHDDSRVLLSALGRDASEAKTGAIVRGGDRVRVTRGGATLEMARDTAMELRRGSEVEMGRRPTLRRGDVLVKTKDTPLAVATDHAEAWVEGIARLQRSLAVSAAAYRGRVHIDSAGRGLDVHALRQVAIPARGLVPGSTAPISYSPDDRWDRRYLGDAMELNETLEARSRGFTAQSKRGLPVSFTELVAPVARGRAGLAAAGDRAAGERLVGAAVASAAGGDFSDRWAEVFSFRDQGAPWGLVVLDQRIRDHDRLVGLIDGMIASGMRSLFAAPPPITADSPVGSDGAPAVPPPVVSSGRPPTTVPGVEPPADGPLPDPPTTGTPVDEPVAETIDIISGLIDEGTQTVEDSTSELETVTDTAGDALTVP